MRKGAYKDCKYAQPEYMIMFEILMSCMFKYSQMVIIKASLPVKISWLTTVQFTLPWENQSPVTIFFYNKEIPCKVYIFLKGIYRFWKYKNNETLV